MSPVLLSALLACNGPAPEAEPSPLLDVPSSQTWELPGLDARAYVVFTEMGVPHIYATNREDLARVQGFVVARDRFFMMDMGRRLSMGTLSEVFGDIGLEADMEARGIAQTHITRRIVEHLTPEQERHLDAYADGINAYISAVRAGDLPPPSELDFAAGLLGYDAPVDAMIDWTREDVVALLGTIIFRLGYETHEVRRTADLARLDGMFDGAPLGDLRQAGVTADIWDRVAPVYPTSSSPGWDPGDPPGDAGRRSAAPEPPDVPVSMLDRLEGRLSRVRDRLGRDRELGWGSNAWAVAGSHTADGRALLAADGHLELVVPSLLYQIGLDTAHLGGEGGYTQHGHLLLAMPFMAIGTNGRVAWSTTQAMGDITDWYAEELVLDDAGLPSASVFQGEERPLQAFDETFDVADLPLLGSEGRTVTTTRWTTFDGRWITAIEGRDASPDEELADGESLVNLQGDWVVPGDIDGDGVVSAVSFDFTGLDTGNLLTLMDGWGHTDTVADFHDGMRRAVALSQNVVVADRNGDIYYTNYQTVPCRDHLDRNADGTWAPGANPQYLLDGTRYGGFEIPLDETFAVDESSDDPAKCVVPHAEYPHAFTPDQGYLVSANNDPGNVSTDGSMTDDRWYIGGPWTEGYRADAIDRGLAELAGSADIASMAALQGDDQSLVGRQMTSVLLDAIDLARSDDAPPRLADLYAADAARIDEVYVRLDAWAAAGHPARSGVETSYDPVLDGDRAHAVATMLFNAWFPRFQSAVLDDEGLPGGAFFPTGATGRLRALTLMLESRGDNVHDLASFNDETGESAFFDRLGTEEIETSDELALQALTAALDFLASEPTDDAEGGFGTDDMDAWLWGLRHQVQFESLLADYIDDPAFAGLLRQFNIDTAVLPLGESLPSGDPRRDLEWFPRHGDNLGIDAANPGFSGTRFRYGSGPVMRMVYALGPDGVEGQDVLPGGQSGLVDSPHFADQASLWLANEALPVRFTADDVAAHGQDRWTFRPAGTPW